MVFVQRVEELSNPRKLITRHFAVVICIQILNHQFGVPAEPAAGPAGAPASPEPCPFIFIYEPIVVLIHPIEELRWPLPFGLADLPVLVLVQIIEIHLRPVSAVGAAGRALSLVPIRTVLVLAVGIWIHRLVESSQLFLRKRAVVIRVQCIEELYQGPKLIASYFPVVVGIKIPDEALAHADRPHFSAIPGEFIPVDETVVVFVHRVECLGWPRPFAAADLSVFVFVHLLKAWRPHGLATSSAYSASKSTGRVLGWRTSRRPLLAIG